MEIPYIVDERPDTGLNNVKLGIWLFLASEVMLFGGLFSTYILLRINAVDWPLGSDILSVPIGAFNTVVLITSSVTMVLCYAALKLDDLAGYKKYMGMTIGLSVLFLLVKAFEYYEHLAFGEVPATSTFLAIYFTLTGLHGSAHRGWRRGQRLFPRSRLGDVDHEQRAVHQPDRGGGIVLALCRPGVDLPVPGLVSAVGQRW